LTVAVAVLEWFFASVAVTVTVVLGDPDGAV
jgi:hypothetical protein